MDELRPRLVVTADAAVNENFKVPRRAESVPQAIELKA